MAKSSYIVEFANNGNVPEERTSARIRAFLLNTKPLAGSFADEIETFQEGQALIENLALRCDLQREIQWNAAQCATVLYFLHLIQPIDGKCYCNDISRVNATCGYHYVLIFMEDQLWRIAAPARRTRRRKRAA